MTPTFDLKCATLQPSSQGRVPWIISISNTYPRHAITDRKRSIKLLFYIPLGLSLVSLALVSKLSVTPLQSMELYQLKRREVPLALFLPWVFWFLDLQQCYHYCCNGWDANTWEKKKKSFFVRWLSFLPLAYFPLYFILLGESISQDQVPSHLCGIGKELWAIMVLPTDITSVVCPKALRIFICSIL